jgi:hypothetical protein
MSEVSEELRQCLALQKEIDAKTMELRRRFRDVLEAERAKGNVQTIFVELDGQMYSLEREDQRRDPTSEAIQTARELGGFYMYRLFKAGRTIR